ncbi:tyrosine-protein phosphatase non-receptor type 1-like isoform X2 [Anguilla anguilla]|uniref:tyrosine-protein phosphatase non-receptor type 1-like isoform X2 n=1 Tax=Anguilla anguilla TaxID=7936 RepID=UPI0015AAE8E9|nr:tyrosine-protein phosphatase non-receptor type 1-like isoform X2 [Anguilla anguilla]
MNLGVEAEFREIEEKQWSVFFQELDVISNNLPFKHAKLPENKGRNRYREVSPFDHSRVRLQAGTNDYINASLVIIKEARRKYILTQGPLPSTCGHFWQMVWEQRSFGVVMLNRIIELGSVKCTQYWPPSEIKELEFRDTGFKLTLIKEDEKANCIIRHLELENTKTQEARHVIHFHYTAWPDFGPPENPTSFLSFILFVRVSGCLSEDKGPLVVHCSAGIGRSGVFCLVDTCLLLMTTRKDPYSVCVRDVLLEMRKYRMDLVQTPQQLRFAYVAILEGVKPILRSLAIQQSPVMRSLDPFGRMAPKWVHGHHIPFEGVSSWRSQEPMTDSDEEDAPFTFRTSSPPRRAPIGSDESCFFSGTEEEDSMMREASCSGGHSPRWRSCRDAPPPPPLPFPRGRSASPRVVGFGLRTAGDQAAAAAATPPPRRRGDGSGASLLAGLYLCATLAIGAYICYRACLH